MASRGWKGAMADHEFRRDTSNRLTFEMSRVAAADYPTVSQAVATAFSLTPDPATFLAGLDLVSMHFRRGDCAVELAWENWTGFMVIAKTPDADLLVREIGACLLRSRWASDH